MLSCLIELDVKDRKHFVEMYDLFSEMRLLCTETITAGKLVVKLSTLHSVCLFCRNSVGQQLVFLSVVIASLILRLGSFEEGVVRGGRFFVLGGVCCARWCLLC